jgi:hypothetical protein
MICIVLEDSFRGISILEDEITTSESCCVFGRLSTEDREYRKVPNTKKSELNSDFIINLNLGNRVVKNVWGNLEVG